MRIFKKLRFGLLSILLVLGLGSCAIDGTSYLALDYSTFAPQALNFPMLPGFVVYGDDYQHDEGNYSGAYTDYDFHLYTFTYLIEVNPGQGFIIGTPGADRYYTLFCDHGGPWMTHYDAATLQSLGGRSTGAKPAPVSNPVKVDMSVYDLHHPEPYFWEKTEGGITFRIQGNKYSLK